jgi:hypothetical protein
MRMRMMTRLALLEVAEPERSWEHTCGLWSLLQAARALPPRDPWAMPDLEESGSMGELLRQARQQQEEQRHG